MTRLINKLLIMSQKCAGRGNNSGDTEGHTQAGTRLGPGKDAGLSRLQPASAGKSKRWSRVSGLIGLTITLALSAIPTQAAVPDNPSVHEYKLSNGLKLIVKEDHRAPVVVSQIWYKVGSANEHSGITGPMSLSI